MAIIKCKMCGGDLRIEEGTTVCECEYCGTRQTVPSADNEKKLTLFSRAGRLLRGCEFDKAAGVFEAIVADFPEEAEAYWGLVLCKYGIEYVDDPATGKKVPTCHRSSFDSVLDDPNFEQACENTDAVARRVYRDEARQIEDLRQAILQVSGKEEPYDVFISYKETDENGDRTLDSVIAQDIYTELTEKDYRVFFSRISLEDKLGTEYEPYIFAALNSAKVMLVVGTDYENFDSVWVKNEWSRFLKLIAAGQKKTLIPVFKNMDAYDMPKEFAKLAAQDMGKVGAMQDLVRGVEKIVGKKKAETGKETVVVHQGEGSMKTAAAVKRGYLALEESEFDAAKEFFNQALTLDAECAEAYLGLALASEQQKNEDAYIQNSCAKKGKIETLNILAKRDRIYSIVETNAIPNFLNKVEIRNLFDFDMLYQSAEKAQEEITAQEKERFENNRNLNRAFRFAKGDTAERLKSFKAHLFEGLDRNVAIAKEEAEAARTAKEKAYAAHFQAGEEKTAELRRKAEQKREEFYQSTCKAQNSADSIESYQAVLSNFRKLEDSVYKDSSERIRQCQLSIQQLQEQQRLKKEAEDKAAAEEAERKRVLAAKAEKAHKEKQKKTGIIVGAVATVAIAAILIVTKVVIPGSQYKAAEALFAAGQYEEAIAAFEAMNGYKDSDSRISEVKSAILAREYAAAEELLKAGKYEEAIEAFEELGSYADSVERVRELKYSIAEQLLENGQMEYAAVVFGSIKDYKDAWDRCFTLWGQITNRHVIATNRHTIGVKIDGTVIATGENTEGQCNVSKWTDIVAVATGNNHSVGLKSDGTVVAVGRNDDGRCDVDDWNEIVAIAAGVGHTIGLKADGTVIAVGRNTEGQCNVSNWTDVVKVEAGGWQTIGIKADGTILATGSNKTGQLAISIWAEINNVSTNDFHTVGLKNDGTVVATKYSGLNDYYYGQCNTSKWTDIVAVSAGYIHTVGLKTDGTVVAVGYNNDGRCNVSDWNDIIAIAAGAGRTIGVKANGTVVVAGAISDSEYSNWKDIIVKTT